jgi:HSP20 family protein
MAELKTQVTRWNPFAELEEAFGGFAPFPELGASRLSRMMEEVFGKANGGAIARCALDVTESDSEYAVSAELPGVKKDDLTVECSEGVLSIRGEKKSEREEKKERGRVLERTYGSFSRALRLPDDADPEQIKATFENGVLQLRIQKRQEAKPKTIAIKG